VQLWDLKADGNPKPLNLWYEAIGQYSFMFNSSGDKFAYANRNGVEIWDVVRGQASQNLSGRMELIRNLAYNHTEDQLLTYSLDGKVILWDLSPSHELPAIPVRDLEDQAGSFWSVIDFHPAGNQVALAGSTFLVDEPHPHFIAVIDVSTGDQLLKMPISMVEGLMLDVEYSPKGELIATAHTAGILQIWDSQTGELLLKLADFGQELLDFLDDRGYHNLDFSPLCSTAPEEVCPLATAGSDGQAIIWDANTGDQILKHQNEDALLGIAFSPDGKLLAFGNATQRGLAEEGWVKLMDVESGEILHKWSGLKGWSWVMDFSPDGKHLAVGTTLQDLRIFDVSTGEQVHQLFPNSTVFRLEYTPDGKYLLTNVFGPVIVWDAETGERLYVLADGIGLPAGLSISADGSRVAVSTDKIYQYILDVEQLAGLAQERLTRDFADDECQKYLHLDSCPAE
jgi:WD40 repeat protein